MVTTLRLTHAISSVEGSRDSIVPLYTDLLLNIPIRQKTNYINIYLIM